ncbi:unnamed protein product [Prunus armeniaca]|uniref:Uncharacterized protein n=1 Tax=Prunus armeniaca TaxID=36596 RepID=A0A6J5U6U8_PRUAR|nr:unnamed protein product [Prunus armeniaca]CAB4301286.1 unnamed protein product [Prunus armeniaca]
MGQLRNPIVQAFFRSLLYGVCKIAFALLVKVELGCTSESIIILGYQVIIDMLGLTYNCNQTEPLDKKKKTMITLVEMKWKWRSHHYDANKLT